MIERWLQRIGERIVKMMILEELDITLNPLETEVICNLNKEDFVKEVKRIKEVDNKK